MKNLFVPASLLALFASFCFASRAAAQSAGWHYYGGDHYVNDMADAGGFLWLATKGGVLKMAKGSGEIERFTKGNSALPANDMTAVEVDRENRVWVGTRGQGMAVYDGQDWTRTLPATQEAFIYDICRDSAGNLWAAGGEGLWQRKGGTWQRHTSTSPQLPPQGGVLKVSVAADGSVWAGTYAGLLRFDGTSWKEVNINNVYLGNGAITGLNANLNGQVWVGTASKVAYYYDGAAWTREEVGPPLPPQEASFWLPVPAIVTDGKGGAWGAGPKGLTHFLPEGERQDIAFGNPGPGGGILTGLLSDAAGTLWIATGNGLASMTEEGVQTYSTSGSEVFDINVQQIEPDPRGGVWAVTGSAGITRFDGEDWTPAEHALNSDFGGVPLNNRSSALSVDSAGNVWAATRYAVYRRDDDGWTSYTDTNSALLNRDYGTIATDRQGNVFAMTGALLARHSDNAWTVYSPDAGGMLFPVPASMCVAPDNAIWIGSEFYGVRRFDGTEWEAFESAADLLEQNWVTALAADFNSGTVWAGTKKRLVRFDGESWVAVQPSFPDYPQDKVISSLAIDREGGLWIAWSRYGVGRLTQEDFTLYTVANSGLVDDNVNDIAVDRGGNVWIGTLYGGISVLEKGAVGAVDAQNERQEGGASSGPEFTLRSAGGETFAQFRLEQGGHITVEVVDMLGRTIARPVTDEQFGPGSYTVPIRMKSSSGVFFVRLLAGNANLVRPMGSVR